MKRNVDSWFAIVAIVFIASACAQSVSQEQIASNGVSQGAPILPVSTSNESEAQTEVPAELAVDERRFGESELLSERRSVERRFTIEPIDSIRASRLAETYFDHLFFVPIWSEKEFATKKNGRYVDPKTLVGRIDPDEVAFPFDTGSVEFGSQGIDRVEFEFYVIDGQPALEGYHEKLEIDEVDGRGTKQSFAGNRFDLPKKMRSFGENRVVLIQILHANVVRLIKTKYELVDDFRNWSESSVDLEKRVDRFGDSHCSEAVLGESLYVVESFDRSTSPYSGKEIRDALMEYARATFDAENAHSLSESTLAVVASLSGRFFPSYGNTGFPLTNWNPGAIEGKRKMIVELLSRITSVDRLSKLSATFRTYE